ncbi:hypothetical protein EVAR_82491_1 [Eumeta japonica]|uniref:Uncharacterized protein n=1 Tax=Eumeta variegata TaxID=151549 RepID=A0A4C1UWU9_EUMVA|nr:hypothetical protein EVAR_82491_1 [Eumeta japonica]
MGCMASSQRVHVLRVPTLSWREASKAETVTAALARLDAEIAAGERARPAARLAVLSAELDSVHQVNYNARNLAALNWLRMIYCAALKTQKYIVRSDPEMVWWDGNIPNSRGVATAVSAVSIIRPPPPKEITSFEETTSSVTDKEAYAKTIHQLFVSLDLYKRPVLATENEDFVANVNRKEMHRLELAWLRTRRSEMQHERRVLHTQILRNRALYAQLQQLLETLWTEDRPGVTLEAALRRAKALRDALAAVSARLRAAAGYAHAAARHVDDALPAWKITSLGKSGWERTNTCADACVLLVQARCLERSARRVLVAPAAPRAARSLRLSLDYAFTDALHDHKHQKATEVFLQFKETVVQLINSIHQVLLNNLENLAVAEKEVSRLRRELRASRAHGLVRRGLADLRYEPKALTPLADTNPALGS